MAAKHDEEEMSMEEILASIRKYVTDTPPEPGQQQHKPVFKADMKSTKSTPVVSKGDPVSRPVVMHQPPAPPPPISQAATAVKMAPMAAIEEEDDVLDLIDPLDLNQPIAEAMPQPVAQKPAVAHPIALDPVVPQPSYKPALSKSPTFAHPSSSMGEEREMSQQPHHPNSFSEDLSSLASTEAINRAASAFSRLGGESSRGGEKPGRNMLTIDDMVKEIARPMVKQWIDDHLPDIVEEMVQKEIRRITRHMP
jgi:uncharacterized protein